MKVLPLCIFIFTISSFSIVNIKLSSHNRLFLPPSTLKSLNLSGHFEFTKTDNVSKDFGNQHHYPPSAVLHPDSVLDIVNTVKHVYELGSYSDVTIAARGNGHSTGGQSQAYHGIVVKMDSLSRHGMQVHSENDMSYIDVYGGELWIDVVRESLKYGLTPVSWTDYLYLSVGGTLSNAGISGQTFKYGPQISNVYQLEVVTGKGEVKICSKQQNTDLFYAVLGGLGQFGIITRARIALAPAPTMVKWIRVVYEDFLLFTKDQEHLISSESTFDYIEGFVIINKSGLLNNWWSSFTARDPLEASRFNTGGKTLFCLEIAKYYDPCQINIANEEVEGLLSELNFVTSTLFFKEVSYLDFLDRVHTNEMALRSQGLWEVPHPWLNLLVPKTRIHEFGRGVFGNILTDSSIELILIYPVNKSKWDNGTSIVIPDDDIFYQVSFLSTAFPSTDGTNTLHYMLNLNKKILDFCESANVGMKQYLAHYTSQKEWRTHFGPQWGSFVKRKLSYDPLAILAPGQRIFQRKIHLL